MATTDRVARTVAGNSMRLTKRKTGLYVPDVDVRVRRCELVQELGAEVPHWRGRPLLGSAGHSSG